MFVDIIKVSIL